MDNIYLLSNENPKNKDIIHLPIFDIKYINTEINLNIYDALIFTSKNAIYSFEHNSIKYKSIPSYAIAAKTAKILKSFNANVKYIGKSSNGNDFANEIKDVLKNKKVLYVRAKKVLSSINEILNKNNVFCDEHIAYETICRAYDKTYSIKDNSIIIFTSPSSIKCFLNSFTLKKSYKIICIGRTTASYLPKYIKYNLSKNTSIEECISLAKILSSNNHT